MYLADPIQKIPKYVLQLLEGVIGTLHTLLLAYPS